MKALIFLLFITPFCRAQDSAISYSDVIHVDSVTRDQLFSRAQIWVNDAFRSGKDVTQLADKQNGTLTGTANMKILFKIRKGTWPALVTFSFKILVKDGKYKYVFDNFNDEGIVNASNPQANGITAFGLLTSSPTTDHKEPMTSKETVNKSWNSVKEDVDKHMMIMISSLKSAMLTKVNEDF